MKHYVIDKLFRNKWLRIVKLSTNVIKSPNKFQIQKITEGNEILGMGNVNAEEKNQARTAWKQSFHRVWNLVSGTGRTDNAIGRGGERTINRGSTWFVWGITPLNGVACLYRARSASGRKFRATATLQREYSPRVSIAWRFTWLHIFFAPPRILRCKWKSHGQRSVRETRSSLDYETLEGSGKLEE